MKYKPVDTYKLQQLRDEGLSIAEVARELGIAKTTAARRLKSDGVRDIQELNLKENYIHLRETTQKKSQVICDLYSSGITQQEVSIQTHTNRETVQRVLSANGVNIRNRSQALSGLRHKNCIEFDYDIFKRRDKETAYFCGVLMADGCFVEESNTIKLGMTDREVLEGYTAFLGLPEDRLKTKIRPKPRKPLYEVGLSHRNFKEDLKAWGIIANKTLNYVEPDIPLDILPDYLRGWFDGDGCISHTIDSKYKYKYATFGVSGNKEAMEWYGNALRKLGYTGHYRISGKPHGLPEFGMLNIGSHYGVKEIFTLIGGNPCLTRKLIKCKELGVI